MKEMKEVMGDLFPENGTVFHEQYEATLDAFRQLKAQAIERYATNDEEKRAWEYAWPFDMTTKKRRGDEI